MKEGDQMNREEPGCQPNQDVIPADKMQCIIAQD